MRLARFAVQSLFPLVAVSACGPSRDKVAAPDTSSAGAASAATSTATAPAAAGATADAAAPVAAVVVLYNFPKDTAAFEKYYSQTHLPLLNAHSGEIGYKRGVLMKFEPGPDGKRPAYYRKAELWFDSDSARQRAMATPGFKAVGDDFAKFATGGVVVLLSHETK